MILKIMNINFLKRFSILVSSMIKIDRYNPHKQKPFGVINNF